MILSTFIGRQLLVASLALVFGLARQRRGKPIGFGTFIFVSVGSCSLAVVALQLSPANPLPLLGAVVTGIGFRGAGALIDGFMEKRSLGSHQRRLTLVTGGDSFDRAALDTLLENHSLYDLIQSFDTETGTGTLVLAVTGTRAQTDRLPARLGTLAGLRSYHLE